MCVCAPEPRSQGIDHDPNGVGFRVDAGRGGCGLDGVEDAAFRMWRRAQPDSCMVTMETLVMDDGACVAQVTPEVRVHDNQQPAVYTPTRSGS